MSGRILEAMSGEGESLADRDVTPSPGAREEAAAGAELVPRRVLPVLLLAYAAFYLCRSNVEPAFNLLSLEYHYDNEQVGIVLGIALGAYAFGKLVLSPLADVKGGKRVLVGSLLATVGACMSIALLDAPRRFGATLGLVLTAVLVVANRFVQAGGWGGLVNVVGQFFGPARRGTIMGILSASYDIGNILALILSAAIVEAGYGWRALFLINPAIVLVVAIVVRLALPGRPADVGMPTPNHDDGRPTDGRPTDGGPTDGRPTDGRPTDGGPTDGRPTDGRPSPMRDGPTRADGRPSDGRPSPVRDGPTRADGRPTDGTPTPTRDGGIPSDGMPTDGMPSAGVASGELPEKITSIAARLARTPAFWFAFALSFLLTFVRAGFMTWTPRFLYEVSVSAHVTSATSSSIAKSAFFGVAGIIGSVVTGRLSDRLGPGRRSPLMATSLVLLVACTLALAHAGVSSPFVATLGVTACGLFLLGPYSLLSGAVSLDVAGPRGGATAAGFIDAIGYVGASLAAIVLGSVSKRAGWTAAFDVVAMVAFLALVLSIIWAMRNARGANAKPSSSELERSSSELQRSSSELQRSSSELQREERLSPAPSATNM